MLTWFTETVLGKFLATFAISMVPILELRAGLPYGILHGLPYPLALAAAVLGNMLPVPFIIYFIERIFAWMRKNMPKFNGFIEKMEKKAEGKEDVIKKYGYLGLVILVAIPLPGTGAWTGSLVAALMDLEPKKAFPCIFVGVLIAAMIMTFVSYGVKFWI